MILAVLILAALPPISTVFLVPMENKARADVIENPAAPYLNVLVTQYANAGEYDNHGVHPSLPNYLLPEGGSTFGIHDDKPPRRHPLTADHLCRQLGKAGLSWAVWRESGAPVKHIPMLYWTDTKNDPNYFTLPQFQAALSRDAVANYNYVVPSKCHSMHSGCSPDTIAAQVRRGDTWLSEVVPMIMDSPAYDDHALIVIWWDEGRSHDNRLSLVVVSPWAKPGYTGTAQYDHNSTLRTLQRLFGLPVFSEGNDLGDLFQWPPLPP